MATLVAGGLGAAAGSMIPGVGWLIGFQVASSAFSLYSAVTSRPPDAETGKLNDLTYTGSSYGIPIARVWGDARVGGNVVWAARNSKGEVFFDKKKVKYVGGTMLTKGQRVVSHVYSAVPAVVFAVGTHYMEADEELVWREPRIRRLWAGTEVVYEEDDEGNVVTDKHGYVIYRGREDQAPDPTMVAKLALPSTRVPALRGQIYVVPTKLSNLKSYGNTMPQYSAEIVTAPVTVGDVLTDLCRLGGLPLSALDFSLCTEPLTGFKWLQREAVQAPIEMICRAYAIDLIEVDGKIQGVPVYGAQPSLAIPADWIGANDAGEPISPSRQTGDPKELPSRVSVGFFDVGSDLQQNVAENTREASDAANDNTFQTTLSLDAATARRIAMRENDALWGANEAEQHSFPIAALTIIPSDRLVLPDGTLAKVTTVEPTPLGLVKVTLQRLDADADTQPLVSGGTGNGSSSEIADVPSVFSAFAAPELYEEHKATAGFYVAAAGDDGWRSGTVYYLPPGATEWIEGPEITSAAAFGTTTTALGAGVAGELDTASSLRVNVGGSYQALSSVEDVALGAGENRAWIIPASGTGEIFGFAIADPVSAGIYDLSRLLRGVEGTAAAGGASGSRFVLASGGGVERIAVPEAHVGLSYLVKVVSEGFSLDDVAAQTVVIPVRTKTATEEAIKQITRAVYDNLVIKDDDNVFDWTTVDLSAYAPSAAVAVRVSFEYDDAGGNATRVWGRAESGATEISIGYANLDAGEHITGTFGPVEIPLTSAKTLQLKIEGDGFDNEHRFRVVAWQVADLAGSPSGIGGSSGQQGPPGPPGTPGQGVPSGGLTGYGLYKLSSISYDTAWQDAYNKAQADAAFAAISHTHTRAQISDASTAGRNILGLSNPSADKLVLVSSAGVASTVTIGTGLALASGTLSASGGGGTPGGSTSQLQYNNAGAFAGASNLTTDGTILRVGAGTGTTGAARVYLGGSAVAGARGLQFDFADSGNRIDLNHHDPAVAWRKIGICTNGDVRAVFGTGGIEAVSGRVQVWGGADLRGASAVHGNLQVDSLTIIDYLSMSGAITVGEIFARGFVAINRPGFGYSFIHAPADASVELTLPSSDGSEGQGLARASGGSGKLGWKTFVAKRSLSLPLTVAFTPTATGPDVIEVLVPYSPVNGTTSLTWNVRRLDLTVVTASANTSTVMVQRATGTGTLSWGNMMASGLSISGSTTTAVNTTTFSTATVSSGDRIRINVTALGAGHANFAAFLLLEEA